MASIKALIDLNVLLDVLLARQPFYEASAAVWAVIEQQKAQGLVAAHSISTLFYLYARQSATQDAQHQIRKLLRVFSVAAIDQPVIEYALNLEWKDFEDALQMAAAENSHADYLITRNITDFKSHKGLTTSLTPAEFTALLK